MSGNGVGKLLLAALLAAGVAAATAAAPAFKAGVFDPPRPAPDFTLQGTNGRQLRLSQYRGKVVLLAFGYSHCLSVCPITLHTFAQALAAAGDRGRRCSGGVRDRRSRSATLPTN